MTPKLLTIALINGTIFLLGVLVSYAGMDHFDFVERVFKAILFAVLIGFVAFAYLLPGYIAAFRDAPRFSSILGLNILAGWTGLGWIAALIWSFVDTKREAPQVIIQHIYTAPQTPPPIPQHSRQDS